MSIPVLRQGRTNDHTIAGRPTISWHIFGLNVRRSLNGFRRNRLLLSMGLQDINFARLPAKLNSSPHIARPVNPAN